MTSGQVWAIIAVVGGAYAVLVPLVVALLKRHADAMTEKLNSLDTRVATVGARLDDGLANAEKLLDARLTTIDTKIDHVGESINYLEKRLDQLGPRR